MFHDAREIPKDTILEADLCIVGAGAAGITIARELDGEPLKIILLESGGMELDFDYQELYEGEAELCDASNRCQIIQAGCTVVVAPPGGGFEEFRRRL